MEFYEAVEGDTLIKISVREGIPLPILKKINRFWSNSIFPGQIIRLRPAVVVEGLIQKVDSTEASEGSHETSTSQSSGESSEDWKEPLPNPRVDFGVPVMIGDGMILQHEHVKQLCGSFPQSVQIQSMKLLYSVLNDGADLITFYKCMRRQNYSLIIVLTEDSEIFGGFVSGEWRISQNFHGNGESFVFSVDDDGKIDVYTWTRANDFFVWSTEGNIAMGGGGGGFAFVLDQDFRSGESCSCSTFANPQLTKKNNAFRVVNVECWGFSDSF